MSQNEFATALGFTKRTIGNAERSVHPPSLALRRALDQALEKASDAQRDRFLAALGAAQTATQMMPASRDRGHHLAPTLDGLRGVMLGWPHMTLRRDMGEKSAPETTVMAAIAEVHRRYQLADYDSAAQLLPAVLIRLHDQSGARDGNDECRVGTLTSRHRTAAAYIAAAKLATKLGDSGLAWVAADRARTAASESGHVALGGVATYQVACALLRAGDLAHAERTAAIGIEDIAGAAAAPHPVRYRDEVLSVHGSLLLLLAIMAARRGDCKTAQVALGKAGRLAEGLGRDGNWLWTAFGPTNVAIHQLSVHTSLGRVEQAMQLGATVNTEVLSPVLRGRRSRVHLDLSWAAAHEADDALAVLHLLAAERVAEQAVSRNASAKELLSTLLKRERRGATPGLRGLAARAGLLQ
ncbi:MAG TPA: helix-turn-helix transcriptional regulator [Pseudonocardiaceae bacterium]|nr:helix-turn-helix transcriptional regulator [Pseudonocardiaceae bacterium]